MAETPRKPRDELLSRVTGKQPARVPPPAAAPAAGIQRKAAGPRLTPLEEAELRSVPGYQPGDPIPANMADVFAEVRTLSDQGDIADPSQLLRERMDQELQEERLAREDAEHEASVKDIKPSVRAAAETARRHSLGLEDAPAQTQTASRSSGSAETPAATSAETKQEASGVTGAVGGLTHCPNCIHPLDRLDVIEPTDSDKIAFIQCVLGDRPYLREEAIMGGAAVLTFRTLTMQELDGVFSRAYFDARGKAMDQLDQLELIHRYRLGLALVRVRAKDMDHILPEGLDKRFNQFADTTWSEFLGRKEIPDPLDLLSEIFETCKSRYLRTETLYRIAYQAFNRFNRLVARLEVMVDKSDFWKPTAPPL